MNLLPIEILTKISYHLSFSDRKCFLLVCLRFHKSLHAKELLQNVTFVIDNSILENVRTNFFKYILNIYFDLKNKSIKINDSIKIMKLTYLPCYDNALSD